MSELHPHQEKDLSLTMKVPPNIPPRPLTEIQSSEFGYSLPTTNKQSDKQSNSSKEDVSESGTEGSITSGSAEGEDSAAAPPIPPKMMPRSSSIPHHVSSGPSTPISTQSPPVGSPIRQVIAAGSHSTPNSPANTAAPPIPRRSFNPSRATPPPLSLLPQQDSQDSSAGDNASISSA